MDASVSSEMTCFKGKKENVESVDSGSSVVAVYLTRRQLRISCGLIDTSFLCNVVNEDT